MTTQNTLRWFLILLLVAGFSVASRAGEAFAKSPESVTQALYHSAISEMGTDTKALEKQKKWLTPDLYSRILKKLRQPTPKGDVPEIDGDLFLDAQELPTKLEVGKAVEIKMTASVPVTLWWSEEKRQYTVKLKKSDNVWLVDDVVYEKDGTLRDLVK